MGLLSWIFGKNKGDEAVILRISKVQFDRLASEQDGRLNVLESRIKKLEGYYGSVIQELKGEITELEQENDVLRSAQEQAGDISAQRERLMQLAPSAMSKAGIGEEQQAAVMQFLANPTNVQMIDEMLAQYFPDVPVTTEGLVQLIPVLKTFLPGLAGEKKEGFYDFSKKV